MKKSDRTAKAILVVEDEPSIGDVCRRVLTAKGFKVDVAVNGREAQGLIGRKAYDLYLIDIKLPTMNGKELYEWLRKKFPQSIKRVIFTTGDVLGNDIYSFLESTGRPFLPKPFFPDDLKAIVRETLHRAG